MLSRPSGHVHFEANTTLGTYYSASMCSANCSPALVASLLPCDACALPPSGVFLPSSFPLRHRLAEGPAAPGEAAAQRLPLPRPLFAFFPPPSFSSLPAFFAPPPSWPHHLQVLKVPQGLPRHRQVEAEGHRLPLASSSSPWLRR